MPSPYVPPLPPPPVSRSRYCLSRPIERTAAQRSGRTLAVRVVTRGTRDGSLALVEYSSRKADRGLPDLANRFRYCLRHEGARELWIEGMSGETAAWSHTGFSVLLEMPGTDPKSLKESIETHARRVLGEDLAIV
jgi:hypothetical protein